MAAGRARSNVGKPERRAFKTIKKYLLKNEIKDPKKFMQMFEEQFKTLGHDMNIHTSLDEIAIEPIAVPVSAIKLQFFEDKEDWVCLSVILTKTWILFEYSMGSK